MGVIRVNEFEERERERMFQLALHEADSETVRSAKS
jgi:hypothetical protein